MPRKKTEERRLPGHAYSERIRARFWVMGRNDIFLGVGKVTLLELIDQLGSISQAAKAMDMSYKRAWTLVEEMNALCDTPLVTKATGGAGGGHASLTDKGRAAIALYRRLETELESFLRNQSEQIDF
ncbi:MAG: LysR family transcriptional regulator [Halothiobacillaceae bacterium]|jgi:molybdate transport system regulatory protein|nr:LysR family transcriptional regulator [Halothiobacillaceae bacterium]MDY0049622.1 LysR family transcriptional regulator [Halothiobacillaceae bacterium]